MRMTASVLCSLALVLGAALARELTPNAPCNALVTEFVFESDACKDENTRAETQRIIASAMDMEEKDVQLIAYEDMPWDKAVPTVLTPTDEESEFTKADVIDPTYMTGDYCWAKIWGGGYYWTWSAALRENLEKELRVRIENVKSNCEHQPGFVQATFTPQTASCLQNYAAISCDLANSVYRWGAVETYLGVTPLTDYDFTDPAVCEAYVRVPRQQECVAVVLESSQVTVWDDELEKSIERSGYDLIDLEVTCTLPTICPIPCSKENGSCATSECCPGLVCNLENFECELPKECSAEFEFCITSPCCEGFVCDGESSSCLKPQVCSAEQEECATNECCAGLECDSSLICNRPLLCAPAGDVCTTPCCEGLVCSGAGSTCIEPIVCAAADSSCEEYPCCGSDLTCDPVSTTCILKPVHPVCPPVDCPYCPPPVECPECPTVDPNECVADVADTIREMQRTLDLLLQQAQDCCAAGR